MSQRAPFPEADLAVVDAVSTFSRDVLATRAAEIDDHATFAGCHLEALSDLGVMGLNLPEDFGGPGVDAYTLFECVREIGRACASTASMITAHYLSTDAILLGGGVALKTDYLPRAASGEFLGAFALTESDAGSNPADMNCRAVASGHQYHLRGNKQFISNGGRADFVVVFARTDPAEPHRGISAFLVETNLPGFAAGPAEDTMGLRGGHVFPLTFDCQVPASRRIGEEGSGFRTAMRALDNGRIEIAALALGIADCAMHHARGWLRQRKVSGKPLARFQGLQWMLADMATRIAAAEQLAKHAVNLRQHGKPFSRESAMAKLYASETAGFVCDCALQIHGGYGYSRDLPLERLVRDARILRIYEGASEVQRNIIARGILAED